MFQSSMVLTRPLGVSELHAKQRRYGFVSGYIQIPEREWTSMMEPERLCEIKYYLTGSVVVEIIEYHIELVQDGQVYLFVKVNANPDIDFFAKHSGDWSLDDEDDEDDEELEF